MTFPGNLTPVTVTGTMEDFNGVPLKSANMVFVPTQEWVRDPAAGFFFYGTPPPKCITDATTGVFTINLLPTNDPDSTPINWTYTMTITGMDNASPPAAFTKSFSASVAADSGALKLAALIQDGPNNGTVNPVTMEQLANFDNTTPATNLQVPVFNSTTHKWAPGTAGSGLPGGGTDGQFVGHVSGSPAWQTIAPSSLTPAAAVAGAAPAVHAASHATAGSDPLTPAAIGAATAASIVVLRDNTIFVEDYGAVGNGTTDDTTSIRNAINAAVAAASSTGSNYAEVHFQAKTYLVNGALVQGGTTFGNAILPLPIVSMTAHTVTLCFKGAGEAAALPIWTQTVPQKTGTVLLTTVAGTNSGTFGEACVLGGPNRVQGYGTGGSNIWNNMLVEIDGISISAPSDPHICGFDFDGTAQAIIKSASFYTADVPGSVANPTTNWQFGLRMPSTNNQSIAIIDRFSAEGCQMGVVLSEHSVARNVYFIYCAIGIRCYTASWTPHYALIEYANVEFCQYGIEFNGGGTFKIKCLMFDFERGTGTFQMVRIISDPSNLGIGYLGFGENSFNVPLPRGSTLIVGGNQLQLEDFNLSTGAVTAPTVPATATPIPGFWRNQFVQVAGGTVSAVKVDGATVASATGWSGVVPSGRNIELDYTVAPTWIWTLF